MVRRTAKRSKTKASSVVGGKKEEKNLTVRECQKYIYTRKSLVKSPYDKNQLNLNIIDFDTEIFLDIRIVIEFQLLSYNSF